MKCAAFWKHTNIRNDNRIFPCCRFKSSIAVFNGNVEGILELKEYQKLREASSNGERIKECAKCYYEEEQGKRSLRQKFNSEYDTDTVELKFLELGLDNICNLTCDGCYGEFSSEWSKIENPDKATSYHIRSTKDFDNVPSTVEKILFLGGEPLMTKRHYKVLQQLQNRDRVSVTYNTNGMFMLDEESLSLLKQFKQVDFIVSIDGYKHVNDTVRKNSNWDTIIQFISQIVKNSFKFQIHTTIHKNNLHGLPRLSMWINEKGYEWTTNILTYPAHLDVKNLSAEEKESAIKEIKNYNIVGRDYIVAHLQKD